ncbi:MAG: chemotaxis protein CheB, partial [Candidatus Thermoplasmatota archaeon]
MARSRSTGGGSKRTRSKRKAKTDGAQPPPAEAPRRPTIVALGASAGGLAVFERFLHLMPRGGNLAFLLVSHLDPSQESLLTELLAQHTALTVVKAENGALIQADHVYVIPPNKYMTVSDGAVQLTTIKEVRGSRFPIDVLLRALAEDQKENAVGIIFTGTGSDGTDGLRAIKDNGGTVIVQDPATVEYPGMPTSAIATGLVDFVLPVDDIPGILLGYARHFYASGLTPPGDSSPPELSVDLRSV